MSLMMMMMRLRLVSYFPSLPALCLRSCALNAPVKLNYNRVFTDVTTAIYCLHKRADFPLLLFVLGLSIGAWQNLVALVIGA